MTTTEAVNRLDKILAGLEKNIEFSYTPKRKIKICSEQVQDWRNEIGAARNCLSDAIASLECALEMEEA